MFRYYNMLVKRNVNKIKRQKKCKRKLPELKTKIHLELAPRMKRYKFYMITNLKKGDRILIAYLE